MFQGSAYPEMCTSTSRIQRIWLLWLHSVQQHLCQLSNEYDIVNYAWWTWWDVTRACISAPVTIIRWHHCNRICVETRHIHLRRYTCPSPLWKRLRLLIHKELGHECCRKSLADACKHMHTVLLYGTLLATELRSRQAYHTLYSRGRCVFICLITALAFEPFDRTSSRSAGAIK